MGSNNVHSISPCSGPIALVWLSSARPLEKLLELLDLLSTLAQEVLDAHDIILVSIQRKVLLQLLRQVACIRRG